MLAALLIVMGMILAPVLSGFLRQRADISAAREQIAADCVSRFEEHLEYLELAGMRTAGRAGQKIKQISRRVTRRGVRV